MIRCLLIVFILIGLGGLNGLSQNKIERLENSFRKEKSLADRVHILNQLAYEYFDYDLSRVDSLTAYALSISDQANIPKQYGWTLAFRGVYYEFLGQHALAFPLFDQAAKIGAKNKFFDLICYSSLQIANLYSAEGNFREAERNFLLAEKIATDHSLTFYLSVISFHKARMYLTMKSQNQAIFSAKEAIKLRELVPDKPEITSAWIMLANAYILNNELDSAELFINKAHQTNALSPSLLSIYQITKGEIHFNRGEFDQALEVWKEAAKNAKITHRYDLAYLFFRLGEVYEELGFGELSIQYLDEARKMTIIHGYKNLTAEVDFEIAWVLFRDNLYSLSEEKLVEAQQYFKKEELLSQLAATYNLQGVIRMEIGDFDSSIIYHNKSLSLRQSLGNTSSVSSSIFNIGELYYKSGQLELAKKYLHKGQKLDSAIGDKYGQLLYSYYLGEISLKQGLLDSAEYYFQKVLDSKMVNTTENLLQESIKKLAELYEKKGDLQLSITYLQSYIQFIDSIQTDKASQWLAEYQTLLEVEKKNKQIETLNQQSAETTDQLEKQKIWLFFAGLLLLIFSFILFFYGRFVQKLRKLNSKIAEDQVRIEVQSQELKNINEALLGVNKELQSSNQNLEETLEKLKNTQDQLIQSEKMASLGLLSAGIAHELNNPLNFIKGSVDLLKNHVEELPETQKRNINVYIDIIQQGIQRATTIIQGLSLYSRQNDKISDPCNIHSIVNNCLLILDNKLKKKVVVNKKFCSEPFILKGNEGKLHQAFLNILANAEQAIVGQGTITVETQVNKTNKWIKISDNGKGIADEHINKISDPFFTTKEPGEGTGLGLFITYQIIQNHGGNIQVISKKSLGTTFWIKFPQGK